jgi:hypothetical protein
MVDRLTPDYRAHRGLDFAERSVMQSLGPAGKAALQDAARRDDHSALRLKLARKTVA